MPAILATLLIAAFAAAVGLTLLRLRRGDETLIRADLANEPAGLRHISLTRALVHRKDIPRVYRVLLEHPSGSRALRRYQVQGVRSLERLL